MPTSSIFTSVNLETKDQVKNFLKAWDKAVANIGKYKGNVHILTPDEIREKFKDHIKDKSVEDKEKENTNELY